MPKKDKHAVLLDKAYLVCLAANILRLNIPDMKTVEAQQIVEETISVLRDLAVKIRKTANSLEVF